MLRALRLRTSSAMVPLVRALLLIHAASMSHTAEFVLGIVSVTMFVGTLAAIPWLVKRMPADYFVRPPPVHALWTKIARNVLGVLLVIAGIAMIVLPGQGVLTILIGLSILDLPVKHRIVRWLLEKRAIQEGVQRIRERAGKPPLLIPTHAPTHA